MTDTATPDPRPVAHDHTDTRTFGHDKDHQPVPAWWFNCPRCGHAESEVHLVRWTPAAIAWINTHPGFKGTFWTEGLEATA